MKRYTFSLLIAVLYLFLLPINGQKLTTKSDRARDLYLKGSDNLYSNKIEQAEEYLLKAINVDSKFIESYLLLADLYNQQKDYQKESELLIAALEIDSTFFIPTYYNIGYALVQLGNYPGAESYITKYKSKTKDKEGVIKAGKLLKSIEFSKYAMLNPIDIKPISLGDSINSSYDEYWPSLRGDEKELVFTVLVPRDTLLYKQQKLPRLPRYFQEDFYHSRFESSGSWGGRESVKGALNTNGNEGAQTLSSDGKWLFFTGCGRADGQGSCDIYFSRSTAKGWSTPINLDYPINTPFFDGQPSFSANGKTLFFISNRQGGVGGMDIWYCNIVGFKPDGIPIFSQPENLGKVVNSSDDENSPFIHPDGKTLYYSSNGLIGMGQMDLYLTRQDSMNQWSEPLNFGYPTNTTGDEIGFVLNAKGDRGYFASDRYNNGNNGKDIYSFEMPQSLRPTPASYLKGRVFDDSSKDQMVANFELLNLANGSLTVNSTTNYKGEFLICLPTGINYALNVSAPGYLFFSQNINLTEPNSADHPLIADIYLKPIVKDATIILDNIFFNTNSSDLLPESIVELKKLLTFLQNNSNVRVELSGHTDNIGGEAFNNSLSQRRADAVKSYLTQNGIITTRIVTIGFGYAKPITTNDTSEGRARNRRTEMKVIGNE